MKAKAWHFLWILWLVLAIVNLLFVNVYINHFGAETVDGKVLSDIQMLGYVGVTLVLLVLVGIWWIWVGNNKDKRGLKVLGVVWTAIAGLATVGCVVYVLAFDGAYVRTAVEALAGLFGFLTF